MMHERPVRKADCDAESEADDHVGGRERIGDGLASLLADAQSTIKIATTRTWATRGAPVTRPGSIADQSTMPRSSTARTRLVASAAARIHPSMYPTAPAP